MVSPLLALDIRRFHPDVIAVDGALHGGITGRGGIIKADHEKIEAVHKQIREDVKTQLDAKAESDARATGQPKHDVTSKEIEEEVARRNRQLESGYGVEYGAALEAKGEKRDSALRAAYKDRFGDNPKDDARIQLVTGLLDNDLHKADAAKLAIQPTPRSRQTFAATVPGVGLGFHSDPTKSTQYAPQTNGGAGRNVNYQIDGGDNNDDTVGGLLQLFPLEAIQEFNA